MGVRGRPGSGATAAGKTQATATPGLRGVRDPVPRSSEGGRPGPPESRKPCPTQSSLPDPTWWTDPCQRPLWNQAHPGHRTAGLKGRQPRPGHHGASPQPGLTLLRTMRRRGRNRMRGLAPGPAEPDLPEERLQRWHRPGTTGSQLDPHVRVPRTQTCALGSQCERGGTPPTANPGSGHGPRGERVNSQPALPLFQKCCYI